MAGGKNVKHEYIFGVFSPNMQKQGAADSADASKQRIVFKKRARTHFLLQLAGYTFIHTRFCASGDAFQEKKYERK